MIVKILPNQLLEQYGDRWQLSYEKPPLGRTALSIKVGKKRFLVNGHTDSEPESDRNIGLYYNYYFTPNNPTKLREVLKREEDRRADLKRRFEEYQKNLRPTCQHRMSDGTICGRPLTDDPGDTHYID